MVTGTTTTGFSFEADPIVLKDMEFIETLAAAMEDGTKLPTVLVMVLGADQKKKLYDHIRNENGRVIFDDASREFWEILAIIRDTGGTEKN